MNGQYIIPTSEFTSEPEVRSFEHSRTTSEAPENKVSYLKYKEIEKDIISMREQASEETLSRSVKARVLELFTATPRPLRDRLIEEESIIGGQLFARDPSVIRQRFWCHENDWFFEKTIATPQAENQLVLHYQIYENRIDKFFGGNRYDVDDGEAGILLDAIEKYHKNVQQQLYGK